VPADTVCLTFDFDAVSPWLHMDDGGRNTPTNRSRGLYGAEVGAPNVLEFLAERDLPATWFTPGHTIDSFPEVAARVADAHEVAHHGWSHTPPGDYESRDAERADVERGIESIEALTGSPPAGYRSPSWDYSEHTVDILIDLGFEYSSSGMAREFEPYRARRDEAPADAPYDPGETADLIEVPVSWARDDYPPLAFSGQRGYTGERVVFDDWTAQFDHAPADGVFVVTMHPQVIGREDRLARLGEFVDHAREAGAAFAEVREVVTGAEGAI